MNTKSRKTSSEGQIVQAPAEADFFGLVKYISEREKGLSRYSDKLRISLIAIDAKLRDMHISINVCDVQPFGEDDAQGYPLQLYLYLGEGNRSFDGLWVKAVGSDTDYGFRAIQNVSRQILKQLVRSGRLPKLLALVAKKLAEAEVEYSEVSGIAKKMAQAITSPSPAQHTNAILKREGSEEVGQ